MESETFTLVSMPDVLQPIDHPLGQFLDCHQEFWLQIDLDDLIACGRMDGSISFLAPHELPNWGKT
jgi:hypothetical protein